LLTPERKEGFVRSAVALNVGRCMWARRREGEMIVINNNVFVGQAEENTCAGVKDYDARTCKRRDKNNWRVQKKGIHLRISFGPEGIIKTFSSGVQIYKDAFVTRLACDKVM
jgi:hypothetical protein